MYHDCQAREYDLLKMQAFFHGIDLDKQLKGKEDPIVSESGRVAQPSEPDIFRFSDPEEYKNMDPKDRQELTEKMMGMHKKTMSKTEIGR